MSQPRTESTEVREAASSAPHEAAEPTAPESLLEQDLLVEDISIDGMCGVY